MFRTTAILALACAGVIGANAANLVSNAGFETGDFTSWTIGGPQVALNGGPMPDGSTTYPYDGNQYVGVGAALAPGVYPPHSGNYAAYFGNGAFNTTGTSMTEYYSLSQTLTTVAGQAYTISLYVANDTPAAPAQQYYNEITGSFGTGTGLTLFDAVPATIYASTYYQYTFYGLATSTSTTLTLDFDNESGYFDVDDISVNAGTPEPASLLLVGPAVGGLLYFARRRRAKA